MIFLNAWNGRICYHYIILFIASWSKFYNHSPYTGKKQSSEKLHHLNTATQLVKWQAWDSNPVLSNYKVHACTYSQAPLPLIKYSCSEYASTYHFFNQVKRHIKYIRYDANGGLQAFGKLLEDKFLKSHLCANLPLLKNVISTWYGETT